MPRKNRDKSGNTTTIWPPVTTQITIRVPYAWKERAEKLAEHLTPPGKTLTYIDGFRAAMETGFKHFESLASYKPK